MHISYASEEENDRVLDVSNMDGVNTAASLPNALSKEQAPQQQEDLKTIKYDVYGVATEIRRWCIVCEIRIGTTSDFLRRKRFVIGKSAVDYLSFSSGSSRDSSTASIYLPSSSSVPLLRCV